MSQPPAYNRDHDFSNDYPDQIDRIAMNTEFDGAASSINAIRHNLALIQRDDGGLKDGIVTLDALSEGIVDEVVKRVAPDIEDRVQGAEQTAATAVTTANAASQAADNAVNTASDAASVVTGIDNKAQLALDNSVAAVNTANIASATATGIDDKATQAQADAAQAQADAAAAVVTANDAAAGVTGALAGKADTVHNHDGVYAPVDHTHTAAQISDASPVGRSVLTAANATAARTAIGAGTSNLVLGYSAGQAKPGDWVPTFGQLLGDMPLNRHPHYSAGDNFCVGLIGDITAYGNLTYWFLSSALRATNSGILRIRLTHKMDCVIKVNGGDVAYWGGSNPNPVQRVFDFWVDYGYVVHVGVYGNNASAYNISINSGVIAPMMVPLGTPAGYLNLQ